MLRERFFATLIDAGLAVLVSIGVFLLVVSNRVLLSMGDEGPVLIVAVIFLLSRAVPVFVFNRTLGEKLLQIRRVERDGSPVSRFRQLFTLPRYAGQSWQHLP
jgi:uncharacterized RDD family membrane protein YckC